MRMKVQFKVLRAFTFFLGVFFGCNDALTFAQNLDLQDQGYSSFGKVPYRIKCSLGYHGGLDNAVLHPTRCSIWPYASVSPHIVNPLAYIFGTNNLDGANTPYNPESSQLPAFAQTPSLTFSTEDPFLPYFTGKPGGDQTVQSTFTFRQADMNQDELPSPDSEFSPFQRTKQSQGRSDESEYSYSSPANRNQGFLNKNFPFQGPFTSDYPSQRFKSMHSILKNKDPNHSSGKSFYGQYKKIRQSTPEQNDLTVSRPGLNGLPRFPYLSESPNPPFTKYLSSPPFYQGEDPSFSRYPTEAPFFPQDPSSPYFSEDEDPSFPEDPFLAQDPSPINLSEEQEVPSYPQYTSPPFYSEEQRASSFPRHPSSPFIPQEQRPFFFPQYTSPSPFPEEQGSAFPVYTWPPFFPQEQDYSSLNYPPQEQEVPSFSQYYYTQYAEPPAVSFFMTSDAPFVGPLPSGTELDLLEDLLALYTGRKTNGKHRYNDEEPRSKRLNSESRQNGDEEVWSPLARTRRNTFFSKIHRAFRRFFRRPRGIRTRND